MTEILLIITDRISFNKKEELLNVINYKYLFEYFTGIQRRTQGQRIITYLKEKINNINTLKINQFI